MDFRGPRLNSHKYWRLPIGKRICRLLVFRPKPSCDRFLNVDKRLFFVPALAHASRQCRTFSYDPTVFFGM